VDPTLEATFTVNGSTVTRRIPARQHLIDFLREDLGSPDRTPVASTGSAARARCGSTARSCAAA
jgi:aerobic-type carbon monoxide dehydrogenase small subunit (CoxS/CutS family)